MALELAGGAIDHQRSGGAGRPVARKCDLVKNSGGQDAALPRLQVDVELLGLHVTRLTRHHRQHRAAVACDDVVDPELAKPELGKIEIEPLRESRIHIDDRSVAIGREEPGWSMVEIVDRMLQVLEEALVAVVFTRFVGNRPDRRSLSGDARERSHANAVPGDFQLSVGRRCEPNVLARTLARLRGLRQPVNGFGDLGRSRKRALDWLQVGARARAGKRAIGFIGVKNSRLTVRDQDSVWVRFHDRFCRVGSGRPCGELQRAERKKQKAQYAAKGEGDDDGGDDQTACSSRSEPQRQDCAGGRERQDRQREWVSPPLDAIDQGWGRLRIHPRTSLKGPLLRERAELPKLCASMQLARCLDVVWSGRGENAGALQFSTGLRFVMKPAQACPEPQWA